MSARVRLLMQQHTQPHEPIIRFDDNLDDNTVELAAQLVPQFGYEEAERIFELSARTHRSVDSVISEAA